MKRPMLPKVASKAPVVHEQMYDDPLFTLQRSNGTNDYKVADLIVYAVTSSKTESGTWAS